MISPVLRLKMAVSHLGSHFDECEEKFLAARYAFYTAPKGENAQKERAELLRARNELDAEIERVKDAINEFERAVTAFADV